MNWWQRAGAEPGEAAIAPSMLAADAARLGEELQSMEAAGADLLHLDIMDGHFVPNLTYGPHVAKSLARVSRLALDAHLMVEDPAAYATPFLEAGVRALSFHYELSMDHAALLAEIRGRGAKAGLAINPSTDLDLALFGLLPACDFILIMSVHPGFGGQSFDSACLPKLESLRSFREESGLEYALEVDGGINPETGALVRAAGAQILVSGSTLFGAEDRAAMVAALRGSQRPK